jgi:hypothetical protein
MDAGRDYQDPRPKRHSTAIRRAREPLSAAIAIKVERSRDKSTIHAVLVDAAVDVG